MYHDPEISGVHSDRLCQVEYVYLSKCSDHVVKIKV